MKLIKNFFFTLFLILVSFLTSIFLSALFVSALPLQEPPRENIPAPLNQLEFPQTKEGILKVENDFFSSIFYDLDNASYYLNPSGQSQLAGELNLNNNQIKQLAEPTDCQDVVTKNYVDKVANGEISPTCL